jgi:hypothetical protein
MVEGVITVILVILLAIFMLAMATVFCVITLSLFDTCKECYRRFHLPKPPAILKRTG